MKIVAIQLDLGRQKEKIEFIKSFVDNAQKWGYNTIILYLECSIRTKVTPFFDEDDTYSMAEIKEIAGYIEDKGLLAIPAFENFYHIEKLLQYKEAASLSEFKDERTEGRGWSPERFKRGSVGCTSNPDFNKFFDAYITEVCSAFSGGYVHMGLDEVFEFAECLRCKARLKAGATKKDIFFSQVMHDYELAKSMGKTMLMWDDFFEYYDIVADLPRDIILCHWNYGFIGSETKGHWTNRVRKDWLSIYDRLGFEYIFCAYGSNASSTYNVDTLTEYALKHKPIGAILTIWERAASFYNGIYPLIALCGKLWNGRIKSFDDKVKVYEEVIGDREIAKLLLENQVLTSCLIGTNIGVKAEDDNFIKQLYRNALKDFTGKLRGALADENRVGGEKRDILLDIYDFSLEKYLTYMINSMGYKVFDEYEKENFGNGVADFNEIFATLDEEEKSFEEINKNFTFTFKELFGGGTASLSLSEPEDILNSGIDIIVHPPGKIVVHLDALSGGEKALVAIALYFAIMKVRPAPFCVMDEIEAALDDVNVDRFANYMRNLTHTTQFICITHRRGTMEEADVLYGVTMQDEGVSKLLELRSTEIAEKLGIKAN